MLPQRLSNKLGDETQLLWHRHGRIADGEQLKLFQLRPFSALDAASSRHR